MDKWKLQGTAEELDVVKGTLSQYSKLARQDSDQSTDMKSLPLPFSLSPPTPYRVYIIQPGTELIMPPKGMLIC